jgi:diguanylate cyclase (GGDEF)-like protein
MAKHTKQTRTQRRTIEARINRNMLRLGFLKSSMHSLLIWPSICILLGLLMWGLIHSKLGSEREAIEQSAVKQASSLSAAYAEQLTRTVQQIDQITLNVKYGWQSSHGQLSLEDQLRQGLYPADARLYVTVLDRNGFILTSTLGFDPKVDMSARPYFQTHRKDPSTALLISEPLEGARLKRPLIRFSRRLDTAEGRFDGIVMVAVEPSFLGSFYDESSIGKSDFLSVRTLGGTLLATKMGADIKTLPSVFRAVPRFDGPTGVVMFEHDTFVDDRPRVIAWKILDRYPLRALVGLSQQDILAGFDARAADSRKVATVGSLLLFMLGILGMLSTALLAWRKHETEEIKTTYRLVIEEGGESFYMLRAEFDAGQQPVDFLVQDCNERGAVLAGRTKAALVGARLSCLAPAALWQPMIAACAGAMRTGFHEDEYSITREGQQIWMQRRLVRSGDGVAATVRDITDIKAHQQALSRLANMDTLTTLPNRHWLSSFLPQALKRADDGGCMLGLLFIDLDNFKNINDTLGHAAGDELLQAAALRLRSVIRPSDNVARLGGDEFTIVLEQVNQDDTVSTIGERIVSAFAEPFVLAGGSLHLVHASIGISMYPRDGDTAAALLKNADIAMYAAKASGKAHFQFFHAHLSESLVNRLSIEHDLRNALEKDEFILHYQPRVDATDGRLLSLEALVRWQHPMRGMVPPLEFIQIAEDTGLIGRLGELVMAKTCAQLAQWSQHGLPVVPVSINVSFRQFGQCGSSSLKDQLARHMARHAIAPALIEVELTESCMMGEQQVVHATLAELQAIGIRLLVDDFGTGYSSLSQLQRLDFDVLKVDRAFTSTLCDGIEGDVFYRAIISMAHALGMQVVAEGVETAQQLQRLQELGCDEVQGYYVSRPLPAADIPTILEKSHLFPAVEIRPALATL